MGRPSSIPDTLRPAILEKAAEGYSIRDLAAWLDREHGVKVGHATVHRVILETKAERKEVAQAVVRDKLVRGLRHDLERFDAIEDDLQDRDRGLVEYEAGLLAPPADSTGQAVGPPMPLSIQPESVQKLVLKARELRIKILAERRQLLDRKLHYSGAGDDEDKAPKSGGVLIMPAEKP